METAPDGGTSEGKGALTVDRLKSGTREVRLLAGDWRVHDGVYSSMSFRELSPQVTVMKLCENNSFSYGMCRTALLS